MIKIKAVYEKDGKEVKVPLKVATQWSDVTFRQYCKLLANKEPVFEDLIIKQISILTGMEIEDLAQMEHSFVERLGTMIAFSFDTSMLTAYTVTPKEYEDFRIGKKKYGYIVDLKIALKKIRKSNLHDFELSKQIVKKYCEIDVEDKPITEVIGLCTFFLTCFLPSLTDTHTWGNGSTSKKNWMQGLKHWVNSMVTSLRLTR